MSMAYKTNHGLQVKVMTVLKIFTLSSVMILTACGEKDKAAVIEQAPLKPVRTMTITLGGSHSKSFTGVVDAIKTAELGFRVSGVLKEVSIKEGDQVKKDQVIAKIDKTDFKINKEASQAEYDRAKSEFNRAKNLIKNGAISRADYDKLKAQLSAAKATLESSEQNLKYTELKAPFDGVIAKQYVSNFEKISSSEKFAAIHDLSAFEVRIDIPESVMIKIKRGGDDRKIYAIFDGNQSRRYPLTFKEVSTRADEKTQTYSVKFVMKAPDDINLLPGMSAKVFAESPEDKGPSTDVYVPAHAVLEDSVGRYVYVVTPQKEGVSVVNRRSVVVGALDENGIQIVQGLTLGDHIVTAGMSKMSEGLQVRLLDEGI